MPDDERQYDRIEVRCENLVSKLTVSTVDGSLVPDWDAEAEANCLHA